MTGVERWRNATHLW